MQQITEIGVALPRAANKRQELECRTRNAHGTRTAFSKIFMLRVGGCGIRFHKMYSGKASSYDNLGFSRFNEIPGDFDSYSPSIFQLPIGRHGNCFTT